MSSKDPTDLCKNVKRILEIIVGLLKDRVLASEEPTNKKCCVEEIIKKKQAFLLNMQSELRQENARLLAENAKVKAKNVKLKQAYGKNCCWTCKTRTNIPNTPIHSVLQITPNHPFHHLIEDQSEKNNADPISQD
ncbi:hypothetical protein C1645_829853 [Glomus cerebriforme]|uniref:Uncharacterized protein n=1 Tax=Glomus cerebriforme TaxID=658196 RepID=A0A397SPU2_9GLOM|nr:hypothetical protein C1645_829853 [Glomus cerebriforme]